MKKLICILLMFVFILATTGCAGVYLKSSKGTMAEALQAGEGWYWFSGHDNLHDCIEDWKVQGGEIHFWVPIDRQLEWNSVENGM